MSHLMLALHNEALRDLHTERRGPLINTPARSWVQISAWRSAILTDAFRGFSPSLQANAGIVPYS
jgi:hypothetical protein